VGYALEFHPAALKEWRGLDNRFRVSLKKKLEKRLENPHVASARLHGDLHHCYKIKNDKTGHRLVYQVINERVGVFVLAIDKREDLAAYLLAQGRDYT
jgi:mRNA interferase RelE/StbE